MKEGFGNSDTYAAQAELFNDLELRSYLVSLSESEKAAFTATQIDKIMNSDLSIKKQNYRYNSNKVSNLDKTIASTAYYVGRTNGLNDMASDVDDITQKQLSTINVNHDLSVRQHEINEWSNSNKLDTLYFLQLLLISISFIGILLFLKMNGLISGYLFSLVTTIIVIVLILVLIMRFRYTNAVRNTRYWNKSNFPK
jgi:hypothetical protein